MDNPSDRIEREQRRFSLQAKVIVITGSTGVLGTGYSTAFAARGAKLVVADLPDRKPKEQAKLLCDLTGAQVHGFECDVGVESEVISLFEFVKTKFGRVDVVMNNAAATGEHLMKAGQVFARFEDYPLSVWEQVLRTNLTGVFLVAREGGRAMLESGGGSLINVSSIYGFVGPDHKIYEGMPFASFAPYSAGKAGVHGLTVWLASYWGDKGIRVNTLVPGGVFNGHNEVFVERYSRRTPMGRMADRDDLVGMVVYLASDASRYCTGQKFVVDGGLMAW